MEKVPAVLTNQTYQMNTDTRNQVNNDGSIYSLIQRFEPSENFKVMTTEVRLVLPQMTPILVLTLIC